MIQIFYVLVLVSLGMANAQNPSGQWMKYANPEQGGFDTGLLQKAKDHLNTMRSASVMVIHKGKVLLTHGDVTRRYMTHSIRKSFMSAMYGIYEKKGVINLYKTLGELNIDDKEGLSDLEKTARIHDLITARSGIYHPASYEPRGMKKNRPERGKVRPGEQYFYNNWDFNTLLPIIEQEAKIKFFDEFYNQIANPLGMEDLRMRDMRYRYEPDLSNHAAYLFKMSARDMARFGQLYLNKGKWNDVQIIPKAWVNRSTAAYTLNPRGFEGRGGYGYLWWVNDNTFNQPMYYASGLNGHRIFVFPESEMVIVHQVNTYLMMGVRDGEINEFIDLVLRAKTGNEMGQPELVELETKGQKTSTYKWSKKEVQNYVGDYSHPFFKKINVYELNGEYFVKGEILGIFQIFPTSANEYIVEDLPELPGVFEKATRENPKGTSITWSDERGIPRKIIMYY